MALSGTMSNPSDWLQFYSNQNNNNNSLSGQGLALPQGGHVSTGAAAMFGDQQLLSQPTTHQDATIVTTTANTTTASAANHSSINNNNNSGLSPEGRVSKPVRKRSRASRRTPTTTLNTDTANFRAMVQQFTGGPSTASFGPSHPGTTNYGFGVSLGSTRQAGFVNNPNDSVMMQAPAGYINHLQLQQQNPYLLSLNNNNSSDINNSHGFVQRLMSSASARPTSLNMGGGSFSNDSDEFLSSRREQGSGGQVQMMARGAGVIGSTGGRPNSNSNSANGNENRSNSFLF